LSCALQTAGVYRSLGRWPSPVLPGHYGLCELAEGARIMKSQPSRRKKKPDFEFPAEIRAIWHAAPNLTLCPKYRRASADKVFEHIKQDKCERCLAVYRQLAKEADMIAFLMSGRN
jgi:hypothetical protein